MHSLPKRLIFLAFAAIAFGGCEDNLIQPAPINDKAAEDSGPNHPSGKKQKDGESYKYPEIISTEYIAEPGFGDLKCLAWRITWPLYDSDYDQKLIPGVFAFSDGSLHSFNYLNKTGAHNTFKSVVSLYHHSKVKSTSMMYAELDWWNFQKMPQASFATTNVTIPQVQEWVEGRPGLFETYYPTDQYLGEISYEEGDFIHLYLANEQQYGGIRIVSMTPRIIEVYLAVPNY